MADGMSLPQLRPGAGFFAMMDGCAGWGDIDG
jgi:hypothetical protein